MDTNRLYAQTATMSQIVIQFVNEFPPEKKIITRDVVQAYADDYVIPQDPTLNNIVYRFQQWFEKNWKPVIPSIPTQIENIVRENSRPQLIPFTIEHLIVSKEWPDRMDCLYFAIESGATVQEMIRWREAKNEEAKAI
jgi:hypothetical protein